MPRFAGERLQAGTERRVIYEVTYVRDGDIAAWTGKILLDGDVWPHLVAAR